MMTKITSQRLARTRGGWASGDWASGELSPTFDRALRALGKHARTPTTHDSTWYAVSGNPVWPLDAVLPPDLPCSPSRGGSRWPSFSRTRLPYLSPHPRHELHRSAPWACRHFYMYDVNRPLAGSALVRSGYVHVKVCLCVISNTQGTHGGTHGHTDTHATRITRTMSAPIRSMSARMQLLLRRRVDTDMALQNRGGTFVGHATVASSSSTISGNTAGVGGGVLDRA